jgi:hypothetical protein
VVTYLDGGLTGANNPTRLDVDKAEQIWGPNRQLGCIVSIGTGIPRWRVGELAHAYVQGGQVKLRDCVAAVMLRVGLQRLPRCLPDSADPASLDSDTDDST